MIAQDGEGMAQRGRRNWAGMARDGTVIAHGWRRMAQ